jgi:hypothetical protein
MTTDQKMAPFQEQSMCVILFSVLLAACLCQQQ